MFNVIVFTFILNMNVFDSIFLVYGSRNALWIKKHKTILFEIQLEQSFFVYKLNIHTHTKHNNERSYQKSRNYNIAS
jgi:hypothetical protein